MMRLIVAGVRKKLVLKVIEASRVESRQTGRTPRSRQSRVADDDAHDITPRGFGPLVGEIPGLITL